MNTAEDFLHRHSREGFRYSEILLPLVQSGEAVLTSCSEPQHSNLPGRHYLRNFRVKAEIYLELGTEETLREREDVLSLCEELEKSPEEPVALWVFSVRPALRFALFGGVISQRILGCLRLTRNRIVTGAEPPAF